jgi:hypothetical protein
LAVISVLSDLYHVAKSYSPASFRDEIMYLVSLVTCTLCAAAVSLTKLREHYLVQMPTVRDINGTMHLFPKNYKRKIAG